MDNAEDLKISMFEASVADLALEGMSYSAASGVLKNRGLTILYECNTRVLTEFQRGLYKKMMANVPREIALFMDPIVLSFSLRDACDVSGVEYVWLDLEDDDEVGCSTWVKEKDGNTVVDEAVSLLRRHLEKYLIDAYDRLTREDIIKVWEAGLGLQECPVCGEASPERKVVSSDKHRFRAWTCKGCGHHVVVPSDALDYLKSRVEGSG